MRRRLGAGAGPPAGRYVRVADSPLTTVRQRGGNGPPGGAAAAASGHGAGGAQDELAPVVTAARLVVRETG
ncbi:hypothetical protein SRIMM317S_05213 [Streptomyces rimosus subsp. rimosus]